MLFQPWFSQEALDRLAAGRWRCENGILAPAELGEVRLPIPRPQARLDWGGLVHRMVWEADQDLTLEVFLPRELALAPGRELEMAGAVLTVEGDVYKRQVHRRCQPSWTASHLHPRLALSLIHISVCSSSCSHSFVRLERNRASSFIHRRCPISLRRSSSSS